MVSIGTPYRSGATKLLLLGSGEIGKEIAIEAQRLIHQICFTILIYR